MKGMVKSVDCCKNKQLFMIFYDLFVHLLADSSTMTSSTIEFSSILRRWTQGQILLPKQLCGICDSSQNILSWIFSGCVKRGNGGKLKEMLLMLAISNIVLNAIKI